MKNVLIAVDETKGSQKALSVLEEFCECARPEQVVLLYVERFSGHSFLDEMITDAEMTTLREVIDGTEYKEAIDQKAARIIDSYKKSLEGKGIKGIKTVVKSGHPAEEILKTAKDEKVDLIIIGSRGKRTHTVLLGSVSREIVNHAEIPVLVAK